MYFISVILVSLISSVFGLTGKCDHTPPSATGTTPSENKNMFFIDIQNADKKDNKMFYTPDQTYVLAVWTTDDTHPFQRFMITVEDPDIDNNIYDPARRSADVGSLKTLSTASRYSERCPNTVENTDFSDKTRIEVHWVSPKNSHIKQKVRIRAMVAENNEMWYADDSLTISLEMDDKDPQGTPPLIQRESCSLCSEARYELIFQGHWSRVTHPRHYPSKPDANGYSHMIGASHGNNFTLWQQGSKATQGLQLLAEKGDVSVIEREIIDAMTLDAGARTLIRGKKRYHPNMFKPSQSLFRADRIHHMFSIAVSLRPSPDWFLGTTKFELCDENQWLENCVLKLFPWDAGTMDGVSYESETSMTQPVDNIERVEVGSFNQESPFYQLNFNDLKPFAYLHVKRLDVYPLAKCDDLTDEEQEEDNEEEQPQEDEPAKEPLPAKLKQEVARCSVGEWGEWSSCAPNDGVCGAGIRTRNRIRDTNIYSKNQEEKTLNDPSSDTCQIESKSQIKQVEHCFINCY